MGRTPDARRACPSALRRRTRENVLWALRERRASGAGAAQRTARRGRLACNGCHALAAAAASAPPRLWCALRDKARVAAARGLLLLRCSCDCARPDGQEGGRYGAGWAEAPRGPALDTLCLLAGCSLPRPLCRTDVAGSTPMKSRTLVDSAAHLGGDAAQTCSAPGGHALTPPPPALSLLPACLLRCAACLQPWARTRTCRSCGARSSRT